MESVEDIPVKLVQGELYDVLQIRGYLKDHCNSIIQVDQGPEGDGPKDKVFEYISSADSVICMNVLGNCTWENMSVHTFKKTKKE